MTNLFTVYDIYDWTICGIGFVLINIFTLFKRDLDRTLVSGLKKFVTLYTVNPFGPKLNWYKITDLHTELLIPILAFPRF